MFVTTREACARLGVHANTLRKWADSGKIQHYRTESGQRRYDVDAYLGSVEKPVIVCYCRVSSYAQKPELEHQEAFMRERFPDAEVVRDIASGLNDKRKGLKSLLGRVLRREKLRIVVAHKDRFARFGFELYRWIIEQCGSELVVLDDGDREPEQELAEDLLAIVHVFSCRLYGLRNYKSKEDKDATEQTAEQVAEQLARYLSVRLQRDGVAFEPPANFAQLHGGEEVVDT